MAKKSKAKQKKRANQSTPEQSGPWLSRQSGLSAMIALSLVFALFMTWQLTPSEGFGRALLWGLGFGLALWAIFGLAFAFNTWVRGRR